MVGIQADDCGFKICMLAVQSNMLKATAVLSRVSVIINLLVNT